MLSIADVEANYFVVKAYSYTSITSVMLLDCFTIPCVMVLSCVFLKAKVAALASLPVCVRVCVSVCVCVCLCTCVPVGGGWVKRWVG